MLWARSRLDGKNLSSSPLEVQVLPPPVVRPARGIDRKKLTDGLQLTLGKGPPAVVQATRDSKWLAEREPKPDERLILEGIFEVTEVDVYQFQLQGNSVSALTVNDELIWKADGKPGSSVPWQAIPVHLAKGLHRVRLEGTVAKSPTAQIRFGGPGCTSLDGKRFRHIKK
jgi:hypothetical protein